VAAKTLSDVRSRVRDTANIDSNRISDARLTEIVNDAVSEIASSGRLRFSERSLAVTLTSGIQDYQISDTDGPLEKPVLWTYTNPTTNQIGEIKQTTVEGWRTNWTDPTLNNVGVAQFYTIWGETNEVPVLRVWPIPSQDLSTTMDCRIKFYELSDSDPTTNSLITGAYDAVCYMTLLLAAPYMENDDRIDTWDRAYQRAFSRIMRSHASARYSGSAQRSMREMG
jgi:hypothetical protein